MAGVGDTALLINENPRREWWTLAFDEAPS
jgi:hypothetical protein